MEKIQEILFENKEQIPEGIYLELMNNLKIAHEVVNELYEIEYTIIKPSLYYNLNEGGLNVSCSIHRNGKKIIKISTDHYLYKDFKLPFKPFITFGSNLFPEFENDYGMLRYKTEIKNEGDESDDDYDEEEYSGASRDICINLHYGINKQYFITSVKKL